MKLVRYGAPGAEKPGMIDGSGQLRDLSGEIDDLVGAGLSLASLDALKALDPASLPAVDGSPRLGPCVAHPGHFIAIGLNYADHAKETGAPIPAEPIVFSKAPSCLSGPFDDVIVPDGSEKLDWEVELAFVIGKRAHKVSEADALSYVSAYAVCNDVSERAWQIEGTGQWMKGKSAPTFGPLGPWLVTADEVPDPQALDMWLDVNGTRRQTGSTKTMIFTVAQLVSYLSKIMILEVGDVVTTGTPPGVGMGHKPPMFLKRGDVMELSIAGLGTQKQSCI